MARPGEHDENGRAPAPWPNPPAPNGNTIPGDKPIAAPGPANKSNWLGHTQPANPDPDASKIIMRLGSVGPDPGDAMCAGPS
jgi:hypothetical protein